MYVCVYTYAHTHVHIHAYKYVHVYIRIRRILYVHITYICTHTHTHTYTYRHTCLEDRRGYIYLAHILFTCSTYVGLISKLHNSVDGVSLGVRGALN